MRKIFFTLIGVLLLSTAAFGSDVLFKMAPTTTSTASDTESGKDLNLDAYYHYYVDGSALVHNGQPSAAKLVNSGIARVTNASGYIKITLPTGVTLQAGDVIDLYSNGGDNTKYTLSKTAAQTESPAISASITDNHASYTIIADDDLDGQNVFYVNYGGAVTYVKSLTVSRPNDLIEFYTFDTVTVRDFSNKELGTGHPIVAGKLYMNSDGEAVNKNGVKAASGGKPRALFMRGGGEQDRAIKLVVTDPCYVEVWGWQSSSSLESARILACSSSKYYSVNNPSATNIISIATDDKNKTDVKKSSIFGHTKLVDLDTIYMIPNGGFYIAAIRVTYPRIRPVADLTATPAALTLRTGTKKPIAVTTSSNVTIVRGKVSETTSDMVSINASTISNILVTGNKEGTYVMSLSQEASANYRAARIEVPITVANEVDVDAAVDATSGTISGGTENNGPIWASTEGNITLIAGAITDNRIRIASNHCSSPTPSSEYLLLANGETYTISVPSNKTIKSVSFTGFSNTSKGNNTSYIDGVNNADPFPSFKNDGVVAKTVKVEDLDTHAYSFTLTGGLIVAIGLELEESNKYPLTIANGWATFCAPEDVQLPEGLTAYKGTSNSRSEILLEEIANNHIPSNKGVVIAGADGDYELIGAPGATSGQTSTLSGTVKRIARLTDRTTYCLNANEGAFQQYTGTYIPANKAYFTLSGASAPPRFGMRIVKHEETTTAIENTESQFIPIDYSAPIYNLQGQRVEVTTTGIYMQEGRKYLIIK